MPGNHDHFKFQNAAVCHVESGDDMLLYVRARDAPGASWNVPSLVATGEHLFLVAQHSECTDNPVAARVARLGTPARTPVVTRMRDAPFPGPATRT